MIKGIGADLCQVSRMEALLQDDAFLMRYFDETEQAYIKGRGAFSAQSMAGIFAAKEAFVKALGRGFDGVRPQDIGIRHTAPGAPYYEANESAREALISAGVSACHLSISHDGGQALAFAVLEG